MIARDSVMVIDGLTKCYGKTRALDRTSWYLRRGELMGFLGPNGAGKTTTLRILLGLLKPTGGTARIFGQDVWRESTAVRRRIGYLPGDIALYRYLTGAQTVAFAAAARSLADRNEPQRLAERFRLDLRVRVRAYSKGMRQKLGLILAMMHRPELLILDEPTAGLDPLMQRVLYAELRDVVTDGRTVLFSSHSLSEVETLCREVVILRAGCVVARKPVQALRGEAGRKVCLRLTSPAKRDSLPAEFRPDKCHDTTLHGRWLGRADGLVRWLATMPIADVVIQPPDLEDLFLSYYSDSSEEAP